MHDCLVSKEVERTGHGKLGNEALPQFCDPSFIGQLKNICLKGCLQDNQCPVGGFKKSGLPMVEKQTK